MRTKTASLALVLGLVAAPASAADLRLGQGSFALENPVLALMQDDEDLDEDLDDLDEEEAEPEESAKPADDEEVTPQGGATIGDTVGGAVGFERSMGFYTVTDLGGFLRFGGYADGDACGFRCEPRISSNLQPWIGLGVGYDILEFLAVEVSFGTGFVANAAPIQNNPNSPRDYGITFLNAAIIGNIYFDRFGISLKAFGGGSLLSPPPLPESILFGGNAGAGLGLRWATLLPEVTIGADVNGFVVFHPDGGVIPGISFAPILKYVF